MPAAGSQISSTPRKSVSSPTAKPAKKTAVLPAKTVKADTGTVAHTSGVARTTARAHTSIPAKMASVDRSKKVADSAPESAAPAAKKTSAVKTATPAKTAPAKKAAATKTAPAKTTTAKKATSAPAGTAAAVKKAAATKTAPAKTAPAKTTTAKKATSAPAGTAAAAKKTSAAKTAPAKTAPAQAAAKKAPAARTSTAPAQVAKKTSAAKAAATPAAAAVAGETVEEHIDPILQAALSLVDDDIDVTSALLGAVAADDVIDVDPVDIDDLPELEELDGIDLDAIDESRELEDFDFAALVAGFRLHDIDGCIETLEGEKLPFIRAARRAGKKNPSAEFYNVANAPIFYLRRDLTDQADTLAADPEADSYDIEAARRQIEAVTELLVRFNYGMTRTYVRKFTSNTSREDSADFQGAANVGLMYAIHTFDPDKGRFGSWSFKPIQRAVLKAVRDADFSNMTPGDFERRPLIIKAYAKLAGPHGETTPTYEEVAAEAGVTIELVQRVLSAPHIDSIHQAVGEDGDTELGDLLPDQSRNIEDTVIAAMEVDTLHEYGLPVLDPRERYVIVCRYGLHGEPPEALADIGKHLGLSREAVRQIAGKALARLLHPMVLGALARGGRH